MTRLPEPWSGIFQERREQILSRLQDFGRVHPDEYFYELAFCLLTPQSSARNADLTISELKRDKFVELGQDPTPYLRNPAHYVRFHNVKSRRLLAIREEWPTIATLLVDAKTSQPSSDHEPATQHAMTLRSRLLEAVGGIGLKEASHFLRNIGVRNLAILDRHILKHLTRLGILSEIPKNAPTPKRYLEIESDWREYARRVSVSLDELDLLFWSMETGEIRK